MNKTELNSYVSEAKEKEAMYLLIGSDDFSYEYYPIFVFSEEERIRIERDYETKPMTRIVYKCKIEP